MNTRSREEFTTHFTETRNKPRWINLGVAVVLIVMFSLAAASCASLSAEDQTSDYSTGEPENGNSDYSWLARMNGNTYILYYPGTLTEISDNPNAEPRTINYQTLVSNNENRGYSSGSRVLCAYDELLYLLCFYQYSDDGVLTYNDISEALSTIDPSQDEPVEQRVEITWDPESVAYLWEDGGLQERLNLDMPFEKLTPIKQYGQFMYFWVYQEDIGTNTGVLEHKTIIVKLDLATGTLSVASDYASGNIHRSNYMLSQGYLYYTASDNNVTKGVCRAPIDDLNAEELVLEMPTEYDFNHFFGVLKVVDGRVYYIDFTEISARMLCFDCKTRRTTQVIDGFTPMLSYNIKGDTLYYFDDEGSLFRVGYDGRNHTLLIPGDLTSSSGMDRSFLTISGDWLYYREISGFYRVLPEDEQFPTEYVYSFFSWILDE